MKDGKPDMSKMTLAEQLQYQRAVNEAKSKEKELAKPKEPEGPKYPMKDGKPDMSKMTLAEQLTYQRALNEQKSKEREEAKAKEEPKKPEIK